MISLPSPAKKNRLAAISVGVVLAVGSIAAVIGFVWIPTSQNGSTTTSFFDAICSAAGVPLAYRPLKITATAANRPSDIITANWMLGAHDDKEIARGASLAMRCTACHIAHGTNATAFPNLAGQIDAVIYKQLNDFKAGHRLNPIMQPIAMSLDDRSMRELAAYYADLPRTYPLQAIDASMQAPALVRNGAPMRGIAACASCHGDSKNSAFTPRLDGLPVDYLTTQLTHFSQAARHNDINLQMRNVARHLNAAEIADVSRYYAGR
jgi:cytochrome c553